MPVYERAAGVMPMLDQLVLVNGVPNDAVECHSINISHGCGGTTADFAVPQALFDTARDGLRDAQVMVWVGNTSDGTYAANPDFVGYLDVDNATLNEGDDSISLRASSITYYLTRVIVGQVQKQPVVRYDLADPQTGKATKWTPRSVLRDIFDHHLPSYYEARIELGSLGVLDSSFRDACPEFVFRCSSVAQAIEQILSIYGDVSLTERFNNSGKAILDFFRVQDPALPRVSVQVGTYSDPIASGANVLSLTDNATIADAITRVIMYGAARKYVLTVSSNDPVEAKRLVKGWDTTLEAAVLKDPKRARPGAPGYQQGMELVFRRWYLPAVLRPFAIARELPIQRAAITNDGVAEQPGPAIPTQVYKFPTILTPDAGGTFTGAVSTVPEMVKSVKLELDQHYFELGSAEDGVNPTAVTTDPTTGKALFAWAASTVCITLAVEDREHLVHDTGQDRGSSGINLPFGVDGLTEVIEREDLEWVQFTNDGYPLTAANGVECTFACRFWDEDLAQWTLVSSAQVYKDASDVLEQLARDILRAKCRRHHAPAVTVACFARAFTPAKLLSINGLATPIPGPLMITGVTHDLVGNTTQVAADNVRPPVRRQLAVNRGNAFWRKPAASAATPAPVGARGESQADHLRAQQWENWRLTGFDKGKKPDYYRADAPESVADMGRRKLSEIIEAAVEFKDSFTNGKG